MSGRLATANLVLAYVATTAPVAHVLEMGSKLALGGPLWLAVQQRLYRGWGDVFGPVEIAAFVTSLWLLVTSRQRRRPISGYLVAAACYVAMLATFFIFNNPVNAALNDWNAATPPPDWPAYRARWEIGHAIAALLSVVALVTLIRGRLCAAATSAPANTRL